ncbi:MAG: alpha/beta hydrolase [Acidobacteriota bacterium]
MEPVTTQTLQLSDASLHWAQWGAGSPQVVLLHDGLGSLAQWRDFPACLSEATGRSVIAYERQGHGSSTPVPTGPWPTDWLDREAERLGALLDHFGIEHPDLVGLSDGGTIALLFAARHPTRPRTVSALAAHSWVEPVCALAVSGMARLPTPLIDSLASYHRDAAALFTAWSGVWASEEFASWDIRPQLGKIAAPTLIAQGTADEYATDAMLTETAAAVGETAWRLALDGWPHLLHLHDAEALARHVAEFLSEAGD